MRWFTKQCPIATIAFSDLVFRSFDYPKPFLTIPECRNGVEIVDMLRQNGLAVPRCRGDVLPVIMPWHEACYGDHVTGILLEPPCGFGIPEGEYPEFWRSLVRAVLVDFDADGRVIRTRHRRVIYWIA